MMIKSQGQAGHKLKKAITVAVATINVLNNMATLALPYAAMSKDIAHKMDIDPRKVREVSYEAIENGGHIVDNLFFGKAEAAWTSVVSNTTVTDEVVSYGTQTILNAGVVIGGSVIIGTQQVASGGLVNNVVLKTVGYQNISAGGVASNTTIDYNGYQNISSGGIGISTIVNSSGYQNISEGGIGISTIVNSSGYQNISAGGVVSNTTINYNARQNISLGGIGISTIVNSGIQTIQGGTAISATINGGFQSIASGGTSIDITFNNGTQFIRPSAIASNTTLNGGYQYIVGGGTAYNTIVNSNAQQLVDGKGTAISTTINSGRQTIAPGGTAIGVTLNGGHQYISTGGTASSVTILSGDQIVGDDAVASSTTIISGVQFVRSGAVATSTNVSGGWQEVDTGGTASNTTVHSGAAQQNIGVAVTIDTTISSGGKQLLMPTMAANGELFYGIDSNATIAFGGIQVISGGTASNTTVAGIQNISGGGATSATIQNGGLQNISSGGLADSTTISSGGTQVVSSGGVTSDTNISFGGQTVISRGGTSIDTTVSSGGVEIISSSGIGSGTDISSGGSQVVTYGGIAIDTAISGGSQLVSKGGTSSNTNINADGIQQIKSGGSTINTIVNSGGSQLAADGATIIDTTLNGGYVKLDAGAQALGTTTNNAGTLDLSNYNQTSLNLEGVDGTVLVGNQGTIFTVGNNITLATLSGSQTFVINSDLANNNSDLINITGDLSGKHYIKIGREATTGSLYNNITEDHKTKVIATKGGSAVFTGALSPIDGVNIMPRIVQSGDDWYLMGSQILGASKLALTAGAAGNTIYAAIRATEGDLQRRLGEIQDNSKNSGIWTRIYGGESSIDNATLKYSTIQGGYDWVKPTNNGKTVTGIMVEYQNGSTNYVDGSGKLSNTRVGAYYAWLGNNGQYYDIVAKTGRLSNEFNLYDSNTAIDADYSVWNTTLSAEYGYTKDLKQGFYIRPQAELIYSNVSSVDYTTNTGTAIAQSGTNSLIVKLGASIGRKLDMVNYYLNASVLHEFIAKDQVTTGRGIYASTVERDFKGTSLEIALGGNIKTGKNSNLYMDLSRSFGGKIVNKWQGQIGYRFSF